MRPATALCWAHVRPTVPCLSPCTIQSRSMYAQAKQKISMKVLSEPDNVYRQNYALSTNQALLLSKDSAGRALYHTSELFCLFTTAIYLSYLTYSRSFCSFPLVNAICSFSPS